MKEYSEYVENKWKEWNEIYEIPHYKEFEVKTLFEFKEQYNNTDKKDIETRDKLINIIQKLEKECVFQTKENYNNINTIQDVYGGL